MKVIEGIGVNGEMELNKEKKNIIGITQSGLILVLVVLIVFMMVQINRLQGDCTGNKLCRSGTWSHTA